MCTALLRVRTLTLACALVVVADMAPSQADLRLVFGRGARVAWVKACTTQWGLMVRLADLTTELRQAHFLAQVAHESQGCRVFEENLRYTTTRRLRAVWPSRFRSTATALPYVRNPAGLANLVYAGRMGNLQPGDGWRFRGRGPFQLTGRTNYEAIGRLIGLDIADDPDRVIEPEIGWLTAAAYWGWRRCNEPADRDDLRAVTRCINGGTIGLADRRRRLDVAKRVLLP